MVYYFIFLFIIFIIYFLFAYDLKVRIKFDFSSLVVKVFFIPIICLKGNRYKRLLKKLIPRNKNQMMKEIDTTALISLVHFHKLRIDVYQNVNDYLFYVFLQESLISINYMLSNLIKDYVENYFFKIAHFDFA